MPPARRSPSPVTRRSTPGNPAMKMSMDMGPSMKLDMILVDKKVYMKGIPGHARGQVGRHRQQLDASASSCRSRSTRPTRPRCTTSSRAAVTASSTLGEDTVDGDKTYKYDLTLDTTAMQAQLPSRRDAAARHHHLHRVARREEPPAQGHLRPLGVKADDDDEQVRRARRHHGPAGGRHRQGAHVTPRRRRRPVNGPTNRA